MTGRPDLYAVLGVAPDATQEQIRRAYRSLVRRHHPDTRGEGGEGGGAAEGAAEGDRALQRAIGAYAVLGDPQTRADYDRLRSGSRADGSARGAQIEVRRRERGEGADDERAAGVARPAIRVGPVRWHRG
ncbi:J domain-containing protein [Terrabacter sp. NPDC080008]|uniref:J domain-containing protein n=1 Tax=Terrabacter sp. NPDC080008 TaxID=3155176 RepID=UPI00344E2E87